MMMMIMTLVLKMMTMPIEMVMMTIVLQGKTEDGVSG